MTVRILRSADRSPVPWKNGGGVTHEVAAEPPGAGLDDFAWRISFADVARGGPFSAFPGVDRIITLVSGGGMELTIGSSPFRMPEPYVPFAFSGDDAVDCRLLNGPVADFNVMTRRSAFTATVRVTAGPRVLAPETAADSSAVTLVVALSSPVELSWLSRAGAEIEPVTLDVHDAALISSHQEPITIAPSAFAALVSLLPSQLA